MILARQLTKQTISMFVNENYKNEKILSCDLVGGNEVLASTRIAGANAPADEQSFLSFTNDDNTYNIIALRMNKKGEIEDISETFNSWLNQKNNDAESYQEYYEQDRRR